MHAADDPLLGEPITAKPVPARPEVSDAFRPMSLGLEPKTVVNTHRLLHRAWEDFAAWGWARRNVVKDAHPPRVPRRGRLVWSVTQLRTFLDCARRDRFFALWVLEATSGMRRGELAGARVRDLDLETGILRMERTRVVIDGQVVESDGKTDSAQRIVVIDPLTLAVLRAHIEMLNRERTEFGPDYHDYGLLFCWEDGRPPHPDTITRRFHKIAEAAGLPMINLHDVRHSYATAGRDAQIDWKAFSERIGRSDVAFTMRQYVQTDLDVHRKVATTLAELILGGALPAASEKGASARSRASSRSQIRAHAWNEKAPGTRPQGYDLHSTE